MTTPGADRAEPGSGGLAHIDAAGRARMIDVTRKPWTRRHALARCRVVLGSNAGTERPRETTDSDVDGLASSEVLEAARLAGIQAAKHTARLIPLCHPLSSSHVRVSVSLGAGAIEVESSAEVVAPTGVEMEALTACAVAGLSLLAALLPSHPTASMEDLGLWEKSGGRSGSWTRTQLPEGSVPDRRFFG